MPSYGLPPLRNDMFRDGSFLGAHDLDALSQVQAYIYQAYARANAPFEWMDTNNDVRYMVHRSRYLRWKTTAAVSASLELNGNVVDTASGADSGSVDLDSLGLASNEVYTVEWTGTSVTCTRMYESPEASGDLALPQSNPTFTTGANAAQLNAIAENTKYLLDNATDIPNLGFVSKIYKDEMKGGYTVYYGAIHLQRYLYWSGSLRHGGDVGSQDVDVTLKIDGTNVWHLSMNGSSANGGRFVFWELFYDLEGTDHTLSGYTDSGSGTPGVIDLADGSSLGLGLGDEYALQIYGESEFKNVELTAYQLAEYPAKAIW